jgi:hypothetical protein
MNETEIKDYRRILEKEFIDKDLEIETTLTYISIGALGFFITLNEKFMKLLEASGKPVLIISLLFLLIAFILILYRKSRTIQHDLQLMASTDSMQPDSPDDDQKLYDLWMKSNKELSRIRNLIYFSLALGIGLQVIFVIINV